MTSATPEPPSIIPPLWQHCGHGATSADLVGCRGVHVGDHAACLAHLDEADRAAYLATLSPGTSIGHRGTSFTPELLNQLLAALRDAATGQPHIGVALFAEASFSGVARFDKVSFSGHAAFVFDGASFCGDAWFGKARFEVTTRLGPLVCGKRVVLNGAVFQQPVTLEIAEGRPHPSPA
jgi:hypothetical protein